MKTLKTLIAKIKQWSGKKEVAEKGVNLKWGNSTSKWGNDTISWGTTPDNTSTQKEVKRDA